MGAWIEILESKFESTNRIVAPLVGAWIEIIVLHALPDQCEGAPLVGARIEIKWRIKHGKQRNSRSPRGSVD